MLPPMIVATLPLVLPVMKLAPPVIPAMPPGMVTMLGLATLTPALPVKVSVPPVTVVVAGIAGGALIAAAAPVMCMVPLRGTAGLPAMAMLPFVDCDVTGDCRIAGKGGRTTG